MYNSSPQAGLAALTASPYADSDVMNVRMTPREVAGLQQLAMSYGANEQDLYDPMTGQPRFSFLKKILPMIAGAVLPSFKPFAKLAETVGFGSQALGTSILVGGATGLIEGDLKKGLMAGLGAYSGAKIGEGLSAAASKVGGTAPPPATESTVTTAPAQRFTQDFNVGEDIAALTTPPSAPVSAPITPIAPTTPAPSTGFFGTMGQGISGLMKPEGRTAFMEALGGPISKSAVFMGAVDALTPTPKPFPTGGAAGEDIVYIPGGFNPQYGTGRDQPYQLPGKYYKRTPQGLVPYNPFQLAPGARGFATGGPVQASDQNLNQQAFPHPYQSLPNPNQNYPLSTVVRANYQSNVPQPREVISGYEPKIDPYTGEEKFAEGGMVPGGPETFTPINISPYAAPTTDPNVLATRAYIEELNRRARTPYIATYPGGTSTGGLGGFGTPGVVQPGTGGAVDGDGGTSGSDLGALAGSIAGSYLLNKGIGAGVDYLRDKFFSGKPEEQQPTPEQKQAIADQRFAQDFALDPTIAALTLPTFINPQTPLPPTRTTIEPVSYEGEEMVVREDPTVTQQPATQPAAPTTPATSAIPYTLGALNALNPFAPVVKTALPYVGEPVYNAAGDVTGFKYPDGTIEPVGSTTKEPGQLDADLQAKTQVPDTSAPLSSYLSAGASGLAELAKLGSAAKTGLTSILPVGSEEVLASYLSPGSSAAANTAAAAGTSGAGATGTEAAKAGLGKSAILPGLQTALGAYETFKGIQSGKESQAALGGFGLGAGLAGLGGAGVSSLSGLAALGATPVGLAAAAIAAIGASLVNTKEYGDVALRNYWNAVDQGRGFGSAPPEELAQGFINFYRTNKNEFPGQAKYGRTGNEDFMYDMTQVINNAVKEGKVDKNVDPATMYKQVVQPWLNTMGEGPKNEDAKRIQDFMMTDLINNFMRGAPISNAQVKGDKKFKIVSEKPVYAGTPTDALQRGEMGGMYGQMPAGFQGRPGGIPEGAGRGGSFAPVNPFEGRESVMPVGESEMLPSIPFMPPQLPGININEDRESVMPVGNDMTLNPYGFAGGGSIGEDYNFGFAGGGMSEYKAGGKLLNGPGDGMSDSIPAVIRGKGVQRAALADGEFVVPADVVSHLGNGSTKAGAKKLYAMMDRVRQARTGRTRQAPAVKTDRLLPA